MYYVKKSAYLAVARRDLLALAGTGIGEAWRRHRRRMSAIRAVANWHARRDGKESCRKRKRSLASQKKLPRGCPDPVQSVDDYEHD